MWALYTYCLMENNKFREKSTQYKCIQQKDCVQPHQVHHEKRSHSTTHPAISPFPRNRHQQYLWCWSLLQHPLRPRPSGRAGTLSMTYKSLVCLLKSILLLTHHSTHFKSLQQCIWGSHSILYLASWEM